MPISAAPRVNDNHNKSGVSDWGFRLVSDWYQTGIRLVPDCASTDSSVTGQTSQPPSQPSSQPDSQPGSQPSSQPSSQPDGQPVSRPARQPVLYYSVGALSPAAPAHQSPTYGFAMEQAGQVVICFLKRSGKQTGKRTNRPTKLNQPASWPFCFSSRLGRPLFCLPCWFYIVVYRSHAFGC